MNKRQKKKMVKKYLLNCKRDHKYLLKFTNIVSSYLRYFNPPNLKDIILTNSLTNKNVNFDFNFKV